MVKISLQKIFSEENPNPYYRYFLENEILINVVVEKSIQLVKNSVCIHQFLN